jgi:hypothetical protein
MDKPTASYRREKRFSTIVWSTLITIVESDGKRIGRPADRLREARRNVRP